MPWLQEFWPWPGAMVDAINISILPSLIILENLFAVYNTIIMTWIGVPVIFQDAGPHPFGWGGMADPLETCQYPRSLFVRSRSNGASILSEIHQKNLAPCVPPFRVD